MVKIENGKVKEFVEKPVLDWISQLFADFYVSAGHYFFDKDAILPLLPEKGDLEKTALPALAANSMLHAYVIKGKWITINTYKDLLEARELLKEIK
jgi:NDP-sugar pyrophosphorylase family protein